MTPFEWMTEALDRNGLGAEARLVHALSPQARAEGATKAILLLLRGPDGEVEVCYNYDDEGNFVSAEAEVNGLP